MATLWAMAQGDLLLAGIDAAGLLVFGIAFVTIAAHGWVFGVMLGVEIVFLALNRTGAQKVLRRRKCENCCWPPPALTMRARDVARRAR